MCCKSWKNQNVGRSNDAKITIHEFHKILWVSSEIRPRFLVSTWPSVILTRLTFIDSFSLYGIPFHGVKAARAINLEISFQCPLWWWCHNWLCDTGDDIITDCAHQVTQQLNTAQKKWYLTCQISISFTAIYTAHHGRSLSYSDVIFNILLNQQVTFLLICIILPH